MEYDVIIIGTTIDRITSAIYLIKSGKKVLIIESNDLKWFVMPFEEIKDFTIKKYVDIARFKNDIISYGGTIKNERIKEIKKNKVITDKNIYNTETIIIATGKRHKLLDLDNEEKYMGNGIHFCVKCDAAFYKNEIGCVVGSSDYAIESAIYLSKYCKKVLIIEEGNVLKANELLIKDLFNKNNVKVYYNTKVTELIGDRKLRKMVLNNSETTYVDCIFTELGFMPNIDIINIDENLKNIFIVDKNIEEKEDDDGIKIAKKINDYLNELK